MIFKACVCWLAASRNPFENDNGIDRLYFDMASVVKYDGHVTSAI